MPNNPDRQQVVQLAIFVHGLLTGLHILGIAYNIKRRNWWDIAAHTVATVYDVSAVHRHIKQLRNE